MVMMFTMSGLKPLDWAALSTFRPSEVKPLGSTGSVEEMLSGRPVELAHERTWARAGAVRVKSVALVSSLDSVSKSRWVTFIVVTADSTWVAMAPADEHWL